VTDLFSWADTHDTHAESLARVSSETEALILEFAWLNKGQQFHAEELRQFVLSRRPNTAPDSPNRILRLLRQEGRLDYQVVSRRLSLYRFGPP
jgi:hypothetical protein